MRPLLFSLELRRTGFVLPHVIGNTCSFPLARIGAPKSQWQRSSVTAHALEQLAAEGLLPPTEENQWRIATTDPRRGHHRANSFAFTVFLERGLGFPMSEYFRRVLDFYGLKVHDLTPKSMLHLACFVTLYEGYFGCIAFFPFWLWIFHETWGVAATCRLVAA